MLSELRTRVAILLIGLVVAAGLVAKAARLDTIPFKEPFTSFPMQIDSWSGVSQSPFEDDTLSSLGLDDYLARVYVDPDHSAVGLYVGFWGHQRQGDAVHSPQNCLPGSGWETISRDRIAISALPRPADRGGDVNRTVIQKGRQRQLVLYWYQSQGRIVASEYWSKFFLVADAMRTNRTDGAVVRLMTPIADVGTSSASGEDDAEHTAARFMAVVLPLLDRFLPR